MTRNIDGELVENNNTKVRKLYVNWFGVAIAVIGVLVIVIAAKYSDKEWSDVFKEIGIALIGAGVVTALLRWQLDMQLERLTIDTINTAVERNTSDLRKVLQSELRSRTEFDPTTVYTNRFLAYDRLEDDVRQLLTTKGTSHYTSFGVSGQYALFRLKAGIGISSTCVIRILMADPRLLDARVFSKSHEIKRRLSACTDQLMRTAVGRSLDLEILYTSPIPALRIDIFDSDTFLYAFDDQHRPEGSLPDAARFGHGAQWDRTSRQMAEDAARIAGAGIGRAHV